jgi:hypothetical protein
LVCCVQTSGANLASSCCCWRVEIWRLFWDLQFVRCLIIAISVRCVCCDRNISLLRWCNVNLLSSQIVTDLNELNCVNECIDIRVIAIADKSNSSRSYKSRPINAMRTTKDHAKDVAGRHHLLTFCTTASRKTSPTITAGRMPVWPLTENYGKTCITRVFGIFFT